jgi:hypothetical protein
VTIAWLEPNWPAPPEIRAASTLRCGGTSIAAYAGANLGQHVGDDPARVADNRRCLAESLKLPSDPVWLEQIHGAAVIQADAAADLKADAAYTRAAGVVCAIMTADCLPVLFCSRDGASVAAAHAGWRGLASGVLEATVEALGTSDLLAWLGPAIGPEAFVVGEDVRAAFLANGPDFAAGFREHASGQWLADIYRLGRIVLRRVGVSAVYGGEWCTYSQADQFFSYRRDRICGRMASLIWRD